MSQLAVNSDQTKIRNRPPHTDDKVRIKDLTEQVILGEFESLEEAYAFVKTEQFKQELAKQQGDNSNYVLAYGTHKFNDSNRSLQDANALSILTYYTERVAENPYQLCWEDDRSEGSYLNLVQLLDEAKANSELGQKILGYWREINVVRKDEFFELFTDTQK